VLLCSRSVFAWRERFFSLRGYFGAQPTTIRLKLLKIGALIRITVRKVWISLAGGYPNVALFRQVHEKLCAVPLKY
jgi:hypothetical protein